MKSKSIFPARDNAYHKTIINIDLFPYILSLDLLTMDVKPTDWFLISRKNSRFRFHLHVISSHEVSVVCYFRCMVLILNKEFEFTGDP